MLLNSPQKNTDSHFANSANVIELCDFFHDDTVLTGISKRGSCVSYLGTGFFKFFTFNAFFLKFKLFNSFHTVSSANFSRGLSNWRLLVGRETSLVFSTQCNLRNINWNNSVQVIYYCCWRFKLLFTLSGVLGREIMFKTSLLWKMKIFCQIHVPCRQCWGEPFFP